MSIWRDTDGFFARNSKLHKPFPFRGGRICEAKTKKLLYFHFFLCPVLQGFQHTVLIQQLFACQIGHRAGHPQDAVMGAGGKAQSVVGGTQQPLGGGGHAADAPHLPGGELGVAEHTLKTRGGIALCLNSPGAKHLFAQIGAALGRDDGVQLVKTFAQRAGCIVAVTGAIDLVSDGERCWCIRNGRAEMSRITGTGCQLSALMTAFLVANPDHKLAAAAAAVCMMGLAGEIGWANMQPGDGNSTYRNRIIDAIFNMTGDALEKGAKYELR